MESLFWGDCDAPTKWRIILAFGIVVSTALIGSFVKQISDVLEYTASIAGSCDIFIFPGLFSVLVYKEFGGIFRIVMGVILITYGAFVLCSGLGMTIYLEITE